MPRDESQHIDRAFSLSEIVSRTVGLRLLHDEEAIRALLGRWVSEIEPAVAYNRHGDVIGLTIAGAPLGSSPFLLPAERAPATHIGALVRPSWAGPEAPPQWLSPDVPGTKGDI